MKRNPSLLVAALAALLLLPATAPAATPPGFFGINAVHPTPNDFRGMGWGSIESYRFGINWRGVHRSGWAGPDRVFAQLARNGLQPFPFMVGAPQAVTGNRHPYSPPLDSKRARQGWQRFLEVAVQRYGPGGQFWRDWHTLDPIYAPTPRPVRTWMIWNEQNARAFWRPRAQPRRYARLIRLSARAIRSVDPNAEIVIGTMYGSPPHPKSMSIGRFLSRLLNQRGIAQLVNGVAVNPYGRRMGAVRQQIQQARRVMNRNGQRRGGIWVAEIGWASAGRRRDPMVTSPNGQARKLNRSIRMLINNRQRWGIRGVYPYVWRDHRDSADQCSWCPRAGLLNNDGSAKPAWGTYHRLILSQR